jgi:hypothetical protein
MATSASSWVNPLGCYEAGATFGSDMVADVSGNEVGECFMQALAVGKAFVAAQKVGANKVQCYLRSSSGVPATDLQGNGLTTPAGAKCSQPPPANGAAPISAYIVFDTSANKLIDNDAPFELNPAAFGNSADYYTQAIHWYSNRYAQCLALLQMNPDGPTRQTLQNMGAFLNAQLQNLVLDMKTNMPNATTLQASLEGEVAQLQQEYKLLQANHNTNTELKLQLQTRQATMKGYGLLAKILTGVLAFSSIGTLLLAF